MASNVQNCVSSSQQLKTAAAEAFLNNIDTDNYYLILGRPIAWTDEENPDAVSYTNQKELETWRQVYVLKKISASDARLVLPRYDWEINSTYNEYDDTDADLYTAGPATGDPKQFYVMVEDQVGGQKNVYKCIRNNSSGASTKEPRALSAGVFGTSAVANNLNKDGYYWTLLFTVEADDQDFLNDDWVPLKTRRSDDASLTWDISQSAIDGAVDYVKLTSGGAGYTAGTHNLVVNSLNSDGTGFTGTAVVNGSGVVTSVTVTNPGSGYTQLALTLDTSTAGTPSTAAVLTPVIGPKGGHGNNPVKELLPDTVMIKATVDGSETSVLSVLNDYRQVGLVRNPTLSADGSLATGTSYDLSTHLTVGTFNTGTTFTEDEDVYQGSSLANATASGKVLEYDSVNQILRLVDVKGTFVTTVSVEGNTSGSSVQITAVTSPSVEKFSGEMVYLANRESVDRDPAQLDQLRILLYF